MALWKIELHHCFRFWWTKFLNLILRLFQNRYIHCVVGEIVLVANQNSLCCGKPCSHLIKRRYSLSLDWYRLFRCHRNAPLGAWYLWHVLSTTHPIKRREWSEEERLTCCLTRPCDGKGKGKKPRKDDNRKMKKRRGLEGTLGAFITFI